tara:strand:+ start:257 stop:448 length:192 start_codon:yes stop_codon:yes gene_type:complete
MEWLTIMPLTLIAGSTGGIAFIVCKIIQEEREKKEKLAFQKAFSVRYNKACPHCKCLPCQCGS